MLAVCIGSCLKSVLRDKYIILDTCHPYTLCLCGQGCEDLWSFFEDKRGSAKRRSLGNSDTDERWRAAIKPKAFSVLLDAYQGPPPSTKLYGTGTLDKPPLHPPRSSAVYSTKHESIAPGHGLRVQPEHGLS